MRYLPCWKQIGISQDRYTELLHFCRQYPEWKAEANSLLGIRAIKMDGLPHGSGKSDPVAAAAAFPLGCVQFLQPHRNLVAVGLGPKTGWVGMNSTPSPMHSFILRLGPSFTDVTSSINEPSFMNGPNSSITSSVLEIGTEIIKISLS